MKVRELLNILEALPVNADVYLDEDEYPSVDGAYSPDDYEGDPEDAPPHNAVLLEFSYPTKREK